MIGPYRISLMAVVSTTGALTVVHADGAKSEQRSDVVSSLLPRVAISRNRLPGELAAAMPKPPMSARTMISCRGVKLVAQTKPITGSTH